MSSMCGATTIRGSSAPYTEGSAPASTGTTNQPAPAGQSASVSPINQNEQIGGMYFYYFI